MSGISTHVLDIATGKPAVDVVVHLWNGDKELGSALTDQNGRCLALLPPDQALLAGTYKLVFEAARYKPDCFYPEIAISFRVDDIAAHYHVPLLLSPFGFTTYRGS